MPNRGRDHSGSAGESIVFLLPDDSSRHPGAVLDSGGDPRSKLPISSKMAICSSQVYQK
jgi:hypothetical protein